MMLPFLFILLVSTVTSQEKIQEKDNYGIASGFPYYGYNGAYGVGARAGYTKLSSTTHAFYSCSTLACRTWAVITNHTKNNYMTYDAVTGTLSEISDSTGSSLSGYKLQDGGYAVAVDANVVSEEGVAGLGGAVATSTEASSTGYKAGSQAETEAIQANTVRQNKQLKQTVLTTTHNAYDERQRIVKVYGKICLTYSCEHKYYHDGAFDYGPSYYAYYQ
eukprot:TRINITY_DN4368_c0_g1_i1.p1 TRINITY_DN4368_c0_g1~~TRINITY_DN4368_c0_g1_i1.p1  ORF type:complete len:219 (+),score=36.80 TRINITY_DN4368_c0_g1_i1:575-1231(+)